MKKYGYMTNLALFALPHAVVMWFCLIMIISGAAYPFINGIAVDTQGNLYVAEGSSIRIYQNKEQIGQLNLSGSDFLFTLDENDQLIVAYSSTVVRMDTEGNELESWEDPAAETYLKLQYISRSATAPNGDKYRVVCNLGWSRVLKNGTEEVYRLQVISFIVKVLFTVCSLSLLINGVWFIHRMHKLFPNYRTRDKKTGDG